MHDIYVYDVTYLAAPGKIISWPLQLESTKLISEDVPDKGMNKYCSRITGLIPPQTINNMLRKNKDTFICDVTLSEHIIDDSSKSVSSDDDYLECQRDKSFYCDSTKNLYDDNDTPDPQDAAEPRFHIDDVHTQHHPIGFVTPGQPNETLTYEPLLHGDLMQLSSARSHHNNKLSLTQKEEIQKIAIVASERFFDAKYFIHVDSVEKETESLKKLVMELRHENATTLIEIGKMQYDFDERIRGLTAYIARLVAGVDELKSKIPK